MRKSIFHFVFTYSEVFERQGKLFSYLFKILQYTPTYKDHPINLAYF